MNASQHVDVDAIKELKAIMGDEYLLLINTFFTDSNNRLEAISAAISADDPETIRRAAHSFKGSAGNMAATVLAQLCRQLEEAATLTDRLAYQALERAINVEYQQVIVVLETL